MFSPIKWWTDRTIKIETESKRVANYERDRDIAQSTVLREMIKKEEVQMLSKWCPIGGGIHCHKECIHFKCGFVWDTGDFMRAISPKCKLWR